jgi:hypothetical protein
MMRLTPRTGHEKRLSCLLTLSWWIGSATVTASPALMHLGFGSISGSAAKSPTTPREIRTSTNAGLSLSTVESLLAQEGRRLAFARSAVQLTLSAIMFPAASMTASVADGQSWSGILLKSRWFAFHTTHGVIGSPCQGQKRRSRQPSGRSWHRESCPNAVTARFVRVAMVQVRTIFTPHAGRTCPRRTERCPTWKWMMPASR